MIEPAQAVDAKVAACLGLSDILPPRSYSTNRRAALSLIEDASAFGSIMINGGFRKIEGTLEFLYRVQVVDHDERYRGGDAEHVRLPMAICLAVIAAFDLEDDGEVHHG